MSESALQQGLSTSMDAVRGRRRASGTARRHSVLHIESDVRLSELMARRLRKEGFHPLCATDAADGLKMSRSHRFDVIITSLDRSHANATVCLAIRSRSENRSTPILAIAKQAYERDIVTVLDGGADDCLTVPFGMVELFARMRALLRRGPLASVELGSMPIRIRHIEIDRSKRRVGIGGKDIQLTNSEFELLHLMLSNPGVAMTRERIASHLWPDRGGGRPRGIDALVMSVREKVEHDRRHPSILLTVRGVGYCAANVAHAPSESTNE